MTVIRKAALSVAGLALTIGGLTMVTAVEAHAAAPCAAENQAAGAARNEAAHQASAYAKAKRKLKKAKRTYAKHHTRANHKAVKKARKAKQRAAARYKAAQARYGAANAAANRCNARAASPARPAGSGDVTSALTQALVKQGVPQATIDQLQPALGPLGAAIAGTPLNQLQPVVGQVAAALAAGVDPSLLVALIHQVTDPLTQAGIPANTVADALTQALAQIPTDPSQIPSAPSLPGLPALP